nr:hypothetical protein 2 [Mute swan feces associated picorna-like virus 19]
MEEFDSLQDLSYMDGFKVDSQLSDFLSRPVLLATYTWTEGASIDQTLAPWGLYFNDPVIRNKLENYNYINCNLRIKIMINASPFYYGLAGAFYTPLPTWETGGPSGGAEGVKVTASQKPHVWIYPANSQGAEFKLPFFYHKNWLDLTDLTEVQNLGSLNIKSFTDLLNANSVAGTDCDVQVYAWAEDVHMCGPTALAALQSTNEKKKKIQGGAGVGSGNKGGSTKSGVLPPESQRGEDKYQTAGLISKPASAVARAAGKIASLAGAAAAANGPDPSDFITGTVAAVASGVSTVASAVSMVADVFGYTNVPNIEGVSPFKDLPFHSMASSEISQPIEKLTLDPKNELTVDGHVTGITQKEELQIDSLCRRESYIDSFTWTAADATNTLLWGTKVTPALLVVEGTTPDRRYSLTPMAMVNQLFSFWRGDIVIRIRLIASKYHRGRVRITWDPSANLEANSGTNTSNYNVIQDLNECADIRIRVPYLQRTAYLKTTDSPIQRFATSGLSALSSDFDNGQLTIRVFTQQTSPSASADIVGIISAYGENMEFAGPKEVSTAYGYYPLQSQDESEYPENTISAPMFEPTVPPRDINLIYMGENVTSLKQLLRRHSYVGPTVFGADTTSRYSVLTMARNRLPLYYGFDPNGIHTADEIIGAATAPFNFVHPTPFNWISRCFRACRGSVSWQFNTASSTPISSTKVLRKPDLTTVGEYASSATVAISLTGSATIRRCMELTAAGATGQSLTHQLTQTGLSVIVPYYSRYRFRNCGARYRTLGQSADDSDIDNFTYEGIISPDNGQHGDDPRIDSYFGIGPDFDFHFFVNVPTLVEQTLPTAP